MSESTGNVNDEQGIPGRFSHLRRMKRLEAAKNPSYRFHDALLMIIVFSLWGYRLMSGKEHDTKF